ncbi:hypothetical protein HB852_04745 [Listeria grandensis]|uniref:2TM domain-containing protein n=2 Tax=Listeria grandensis TaxID=1494963 RepID=W7B6P5_9LIST|nr:permease prefix domain 1-containing protein [Listeria grandensis]EUJ18521.1 hypothetical protein PGRAN_15687 [Listeria grandensis FSL F6-0971]MBC1473914.1 hypothetical protein [Listeria grandensis]MBC1936068.1 hypothetical protein [Listeria grandensis]MBC6316117.1 hypothetical protein [Listeria grandensis]
MITIKKHVDLLFADIPVTEESLFMKEEILHGLEDKVDVLMAHGKSEEDAINKAIVELGDLTDLRMELAEYRVKPPKSYLAWTHFQFSIVGAALIIGLLLFINIYYTPHVLWVVFPAFGIVWWPLAMYFRCLRVQGEVMN